MPAFILLLQAILLLLSHHISNSELEFITNITFVNKKKYEKKYDEKLWKDFEKRNQRGRQLCNHNRGEVVIITPVKVPYTKRVSDP